MAEPMLHNDELFAALVESERDPDDAVRRSADTGVGFDDLDVELDDEEEEDRPARVSGRREVRGAHGASGAASRRSSHPPNALAERAVLRVEDLAGGKYRVDRIIGRRGSGVLAEATHVELGQSVTIRHPPREVRARPSVVARFLRQARAACQIHSEHAARILDAGRLDSGVPFMVMEGLKGWDLDEVLRVRGPLPVEDAVDYLVQACEAVAEAHGMGLIHRSISTSSLMLTRRPDGSALVKVLDFGVPDVLQSVPFAELAGVDAESFMGALRFLSPEQIRSPDDVDSRADLWALGAVLHEILTGGPPFFGASPGALMAAIAADPPRATGAVLRGVPPEIEAVILRCLSKDRHARFQNVAEFVLALRAFAPADSVRTVERISRMSLPSRPPPLPAAPSSVAAVAVPRAAPASAKTADKYMPPWLAVAGVVGALVGASLAFGTDRLHAARPEAATAVEKPTTIEPTVKTAATAAPLATAAQPAASETATTKPAAPTATAPLPAHTRPAPKALVAPAAPGIASTAEHAKETSGKAASAATNSGKPTSSAPSAQAARDLFDDTR